MTQSRRQSLNSSSEELALVSGNPMDAHVMMGTVQVLVWFFIYINSLMLFTFFSKQAFRGDTRYILFAHTLLVDCIFLMIINLVVMLTYFQVLLPVRYCIPLCIVMEIVTNSTPMTIVVMCLERYVAICMPLRHADISTPSRTMFIIIILAVISAFNPFLDLFILTDIAPPGYFAKRTYCHYEIMLLADWHFFMRAIVYQVDCAVLVVIIVFCYVKIMLAAQTAAGENKQSMSKGRRTLLLHGVQLFLCMMDTFGPLVEEIVLEHNPQVYLSIRFFNFIVFTIISRALSPLVYGLRDQKFFLALRNYTHCKANLISTDT